MDRRDFLKKSALGIGTVAVSATGCDRLCDDGVKTVDTPLKCEGYLQEPSRKIPVVATTDVVVAGGGPAGVSAAISAARAGVSVWLIERYNHLGGLWTGGLVLPLNSSHGTDKNGNFIKVIHGVAGEVVDRLATMGMVVNNDSGGEYVNPSPDPEACKYVLDCMTTEAGVNLLYHSTVAGVIQSGDRIDAVLVESKSGRVAIKCKMVVDCTGDGDFMAWTGQSHRVVHYHAGLNYRLGNVDRINESADGFQRRGIGAKTPLKSVNWVNVHGHDNTEALDVMELSRIQVNLRKSAWESTQELRKYPGYEEVFLLDTASQLGIRASRLLNSLHNVSLKESMEYTSYPDSIGVSGAWTNIVYDGKTVSWKKRPYWQIPLRSLLPEKCPNLIVAGRSFGYEWELLEDAREVGTCMVTGQGAGVAAALASVQRCPVKDVDVSSLQTVLKSQNVKLD